ncbi:MAG: hypothetical protein HWN65_00480 [Candidatus Helarchaeota archaeon]|nr:hypothetical protein [Candidatus Helarchaeota archaeon]
MGETEPKNEAIYDGWYGVAEPVNKFVAFVTMGLGVLAYLVYTAPLARIWPTLWVRNIWILIFPVVGGILYLIMVQKSVADKDLNKKMHIWLLICTGVSCVGYLWAAGLMILQFVMVGILSDKPFWKAFGE